MAGGSKSPTGGRSWARTLERAVFLLLVALGGTTILAASWSGDYAQPRATLLGSERGISVLVTAGSARVLILNGTDPTALGNALSKARHPGLERLDLMIVPGNAGAATLAPRAIELLAPRAVMTVGGDASLAGTSIVPLKIIDRSTAIELPEGVTIAIDLWAAADGENDDVTWSARIERGDASIYWVSDREELMQDSLPAEVNVTVIGRGAPVNDTPFPLTRTIVVAGESISGPDLRTLAFGSLGPDVDTKRIYAGEIVRIDLDAAGIGAVPGALPAASPTAT